MGRTRSPCQWMRMVWASHAGLRLCLCPWGRNARAFACDGLGLAFDVAFADAKSLAFALGGHSVLVLALVLVVIAPLPPLVVVVAVVIVLIEVR